MDELGQTVNINENLRDQKMMNSILQFKCSDCITSKLLKVSGNLFGEDSDEEDGKEQSDPVSDPLSDSMPDKNKHSKSEKSLKVSIQMFNEEQK